MSWRDGLPDDRLLTDDQLQDLKDHGMLHLSTKAAVELILSHHATLVTEIERLRSELHAGHTTVPQSIYTAPNVRSGWMICTRCKYETPQIGYCAEHKALDKCWADREKEPK